MAGSFRKWTVFSVCAATLTLSGAVSDGRAPVRVAVPSPAVVAPALVDVDREAERLARIEPAAAPASMTIRAVSAISLHNHFVQRGYTLDAVRKEGEAVPRVFLAQLPRDLPTLLSPDFRKTVFIKMMLPLVLAENERIRKDRVRALQIREDLENDMDVAAEELAWLARLSERYGVDDGNLDELFRRVDVISPSLALAQAALETGWGTSSVAQRGHAMFGQMVFRVASDGGIEASVKMFRDLAAAVEAYAHNLNTHRAYAEFRHARAQMRENGRAPDGYELALHLVRYSERKEDYVQAVRGLIRVNNLQPFDHARLDG